MGARRPGNCARLLLIFFSVGSSSGVLPLTADNIKRLQDQYARISPLPLEQRVLRWLQSIPMFVGDGQPDAAAPTTDYYAQSLGGGLAAAMPQAPAPMNQDPVQRFFEQQDELRAQQAAARAAAQSALLQGDLGLDPRKDLTGMTTRSRTVRAPAIPGMPVAGGLPKYPAGIPGLERAPSGSGTGRDDRAKPNSKGRLCCYLKVEVSGNTQMLPIHEVRFSRGRAADFRV